MADKKISALPAATTPLAGTEVLPIVQGGTTDQVSVANLTAGRDVSAKTLTGESNGAGAVTEIFARNSAGPERVQIISRNTAGVSYVQTQNSQMLIGSFDNFAVQFMVNNASKLVLDTTSDVKVSTGNLVIGTAGKGIDFSASTHAAGMTSELLNDYEEGTFTPVASQLTTAPTIVYSSQIGKYTKVGRVVTAHIELILTTAVGGLGTTVITGLPYAPDEGTYGGQGMIGYNDALANTVYGCWVSGTSVVFRSGTRGSANDTGGWSSGGYLALTLVYQV